MCRSNDMILQQQQRLNKVVVMYIIAGTSVGSDP